MNRRVPVSFIGPTRKDASGVFFEIMSANGGTIRLDYPGFRQANKARKDLSKAETAHRVPNQTLFAALQQLVTDKETHHVE